MFNRKPILAGASCLQGACKHEFPRLCPCTKTDISYSFWKLQALNIDCWHPMGARIQYAPILSIVRAWSRSTKKILVVFSLDFLLPYLLCYILQHYFNISTNHKVFSFQWYQLYAYPGFRAWATGSLLWARHSIGNWEIKRGLALTEFLENVREILL